MGLVQGGAGGAGGDGGEGAVALGGGGICRTRQPCELHVQHLLPGILMTADANAKSWCQMLLMATYSIKPSTQ